MRRSDGVAAGQLRGPGRQLNANSGLCESNYSGVMPTTRRRNARSSLIRLRCLNWPYCRGSLFYVPRHRPPADPLQPLRPFRRGPWHDPTLWAVTGVGTDGMSTALDGDDVREDFWTAEVHQWLSRCPNCGHLHYLPAPETRAQVAAAVAKGQPFVTLASPV
jgi:hypothetical protein